MDTLKVEEAEVITPNQSPLPTTEMPDMSGKTFDFYEAIKKMHEGKKVTKLEWKNKAIYGILKDTLVQLHKADDKFYGWAINEGDIIGTDWVVIE